MRDANQIDEKRYTGVLTIAPLLLLALPPAMAVDLYSGTFSRQLRKQ